jgi:hypothetical protein
VRNLFVAFTTIFIFSIIFFIIFYDKSFVRKAAKYNLFAIPLFALILLFFSTFWNQIFHPILFRNDYWIVNPNQLSYYLFPTQFFVNTSIFIFSTYLFSNLALYIISSRYENLKS